MIGENVRCSRESEVCMVGENDRSECEEHWKRM